MLCWLQAHAALPTERITAMYRGRRSCWVALGGDVRLPSSGKAVSEARRAWGGTKQNPLMGWAEGPLGMCFRQELPDHTCMAG